ncbi:hypothetical protein AGMMS49965_08090 [Bacteroidia bacterium]|nr:hypothetical protein AGMMS49965_08090 [Bacteroidia bacterium]
MYFCGMKVKIRIWLLCVVLSCPPTQAAEEWLTSDARAFSLGQLHALSDELLNPAQMAIANRREAGLSVYNRFQMSELNTAGLYAKLPNQWLDAAAKLTAFGYNDYQIIAGQASFAKKIFADFAIGLNLAVINENSVLAEASQTHFTTGLGAFWRYNSQFDWTVLIENIVHNVPKDDLLQMFGGCSYKPLAFASVLLEANYNKRAHFNLSIGLEYEILKQFTIRSGIMTRTSTPSFGIGYQWNSWQADVGFSLHPELGISSMIGIRTTFL